jgi:ribosome-associated protein
MLSIRPDFQIPLEEFEFTFARSGGPGGQNVNKVNSKAVLRWTVVASPSLPEDVRGRFLQRYANQITLDGELIVTSQRSRDRGANIEDCLQKVKDMVLNVLNPPTPRRPTRPGRAARERRTQAKRETAQKKQRRQRPHIDD